MSEQDMEEPREDDRNDELGESPVPDPERSESDPDEDEDEDEDPSAD